MFLIRRHPSAMQNARYRYGLAAERKRLGDIECCRLGRLDDARVSSALSTCGQLASVAGQPYYFRNLAP